MSFVEDNLVAVGDKTLKSQYDQLLANAAALKDANPRVPLGGLFQDIYTNTGYQELFGVVHAEIDGTNLSGLTVNLVCMGKVVAGTGYIKLYKITATPGDVAGSETTFTNTTANRIVSSALTLTSGVNEYKALVRVAGATNYAQIWNAVISIK